MWGPRAPLYTWVLSKFYPRKQCFLVSRPNSETVPECSENNSLSAGWSYRPQNHQASLPEAQGAHPKTQRLQKFARVKKGGRGFFAPWVALRARWGWNRSERVAFCGTRADIASTIAGFRPSCSKQATLLATFPKRKHWRCSVAFWEAKYRGLRTPRSGSDDLNGVGTQWKTVMKICNVEPEREHGPPLHTKKLDP